MVRRVEASLATPRARAIWAYSGLSQRELAEKAGLNYHRVRAILGESKADEVSLEELHALADAAEIPRQFGDDGFEALREAYDLRQKFVALQQAVRQLRRDQDQGRARAAEHAAEVAKQFSDMQKTMSRLQSRRRP